MVIVGVHKGVERRLVVALGLDDIALANMTHSLGPTRSNDAAQSVAVRELADNAGFVFTLSSKNTTRTA